MSDPDPPPVEPGARGRLVYDRASKTIRGSRMPGRRRRGHAMITVALLNALAWTLMAVLLIPHVDPDDHATAWQEAAVLITILSVIFNLLFGLKALIPPKLPTP